jgi:hypothetical protein
VATRGYAHTVERSVEMRSRRPVPNPLEAGRRLVRTSLLRSSDHYVDWVERAHPVLAARLASGTQVSRLVATRAFDGFDRPAAGPGWVLTGTRATSNIPRRFRASTTRSLPPRVLRTRSSLESRSQTTSAGATKTFPNATPAPVGPAPFPTTTAWLR